MDIEWFFKELEGFIEKCGSQRKAAAALGISSGNITGYIRRVNKPSLEVATRLLTLIGGHVVIAGEESSLGLSATERSELERLRNDLALARERESQQQEAIRKAVDTLTGVAKPRKKRT